jgi:hypothetical protein
MSELRHIVPFAVTFLFSASLSACTDQKEICREHAFLVDPTKRDVIMCIGGAKVSHTQTPQGLVFMCTCPEKEKKQ